MSPTITQQKALIRQRINEQRKRLDPVQIASSSESCCDLIIQSNILEAANNIALYIQHKGELNPRPLLDYLWKRGKTSYLPVIQEDGSLKFAHYEKDSKMHLNQYGIEEPISEKFCSLENLDVICMPLVAFDVAGHRLGMGGGYYDRTLEKLSKENTLKTIGIAYEFQKVEQVPIEEWDQSMDWIATEQNIYQS